MMGGTLKKHIYFPIIIIIIVYFFTLCIFFVAVFVS